MRRLLPSPIGQPSQTASQQQPGGRLGDGRSRKLARKAVRKGAEEGWPQSFAMLLELCSEGVNDVAGQKAHVGDGKVAGQGVASVVIETDIKSWMPCRSEVGTLSIRIKTRLNWNAKLVRAKK